MITEATTVGLALATVAEYLRTRRGPLVLLALAVTHTRASLVTAAWIVRKVPGLWRVAYPQAVTWVKEQG